MTAKRTQNESNAGHIIKLNEIKPDSKKEKKPFGEFGQVLLTSDELNKLRTDLPDTWEDWIKRLDIGKAMKGYQYASDYAAIRCWIENEEKAETEKAYRELMDELNF